MVLPELLDVQVLSFIRQGEIRTLFLGDGAQKELGMAIGQALFFWLKALVKGRGPTLNKDVGVLGATGSATKPLLLIQLLCREFWAD